MKYTKMHKFKKFNQMNTVKRSLQFALIPIMSLFINLNAIAQFGGSTPVKVAQVTQQLMAPVRKVPATVEAKFVTMIKSESRGIVNNLAEIGSTIKKGEVLAVLTDTQTNLRKQELKGAENSSLAKLNFLQAENKRLNELVAKNLISSSELEQNKSELISAKNDLVQSKSRLKQFIDQVGKLSIKAPYDGIVMQQLAKPGQLLDSGDNVVELMQSNNLEVMVNVPFKYKSQIKAGMVWKIETQENTMIDATVERFVPAATGNSHTIEVYLTINNEELWSGEAVNVLVPTATAQTVMAVPRDALVIRRDSAYLFTVKDNKSNKVNVITGIAQGDLIAVKGQLSEGDTVIVRGNERMQNGQDLNIIE